MVLRAEYGTLKRWMQALPADLLSQHPWLCTRYAGALLFGESEAAEAQLRTVEQHLQAGEGTLLSVEMQGHITAVRAWIAYRKGEPDRAVSLSRRAQELWPQMDPAIGCGLMALVGVGCIAQDDLAAGASAFAQARDLAQAGGNVLVEVAAQASLGTVSETMGHLHEAEAIYREALERALLHKSPTVAEAYIRLARVHREWNDLESARAFAEKLMESSATWGVENALANGYLSLAAVLQAQNDIHGASKALAEVDRLFREHRLEPRSVPELGAMRAKLWVAQGRLTDARRWAAARGLDEEGEFDRYTEVEYVSLVRLLLAEDRVDHALRLLSRLHAVMESAGRYGHLIEVLVLQAVALGRQGDAPSALANLRRAVSLAHTEGYVRVFLDEGQRVEALLKTAVTQWDNHELLAYARKLLIAFHQEQPERPVPPRTLPGGPLIEPLSERELQVLRLVAAGWLNQEIAGKLVISVRTVKKHVQNIHGKLGVRNRTEAGARARELNLL